MRENYICNSPEETFELGERIGGSLVGGEIFLLTGGLGAGKTLLAKGILSALGYDADEVNSPSFTLVNLYKTGGSDVYHIDLWRIDEKGDAAHAVGLDEVLDADANIVIIEWAEKIGNYCFPRKTITISIDGDGDDPRSITIDGFEIPE